MAALLGGAVLLSEWLAENPNGWLETHAAQGTRMVHGDTTFLDLQSTVAIVTILITVTIIFENIKHFLEHKVPPMMSAVLSALFGELTVLGFLALYAFFMPQTGVIPTVSILVYGDSERMVHLFEDIHLLLFFVLFLLPLLQVVDDLHFFLRFPRTTRVVTGVLTLIAISSLLLVLSAPMGRDKGSAFFAFTLTFFSLILERSN